MRVLAAQGSNNPGLPPPSDCPQAEGPSFHAEITFLRWANASTPQAAWLLTPFSGTSCPLGALCSQVFCMGAFLRFGKQWFYCISHSACWNVAGLFPKTGSVRCKGRSGGSPGDGASVSGAFWGRKMLLLGEHTCWFSRWNSRKSQLLGPVAHRGGKHDLKFRPLINPHFFLYQGGSCHSKSVCRHKGQLTWIETWN